MTLPASGAISASEINVELGRSSTATFSMNGADERALAEDASGAISFSTFHGKSARSVTLVDTSSSASESVSYGADTDGRWIAILAVGGNDSSAYNLSATISGVAGTVIEAHSSGSGGGTATGTAIIVGQPSGTSGTVTVSGTTTMRFYVLRITGYDMSSAVDTDDSTGNNIPPWSVNVPANGLCLAIVQNSDTNGITWTGLTERISENALITGKNSSAAWDVNMSADATTDVDVTASDSDGATSACIATFAAA